MFYNPPESCQIPKLGEMWEELFGKRNAGYFVEVGAYDGESFSNTSCLADVGWSGLYLEPVSEFADKCRQRHAGNLGIEVEECAVSNFDGCIDIYIGGTLTTTSLAQVTDYEKIDWAKDLHKGERRSVVSRKLDTVLTQYGVPRNFDLLSIDVEGAEDKVIEGFNVQKWRPRVVLVELEDEHPDFISNERTQKSALYIKSQLRSAGYKVYFKDQINALYVLDRGSFLLTNKQRRYLDSAGNMMERIFNIGSNLPKR